MSSNPRKRKIDEEGRVFNESWTFDYFVISHADSALCLICHERIKTLKTFKIKRHYESQHKNYFSLQGDVRSNKISLKKSVSAQQKGKPPIDGEFVKECMIKTVKEICPEKLSLFQNVSLSASTVTKRKEDLSGEVFSTLSEKEHSFQYFSLALDESNDILDTAQLLIFIRGVDKNFQVVEDLCALRSMKDTTTSENLFLEVHQAVNNLDLCWAKLKSVTTDGARNMVGSKTGLLEKICNEVVHGTPPLKFHCIIHQQVLCSKVLKIS
ncbi:general transcription factor II-I repeat domain-containing protein 2-like [Macrobrachium nipponense]|uniref:general transcription factor II-I repeat domain-containing protein 2-like n=1 Tax=Macrobrachium nipponense TaxID=159736 RepID=UPI0030C82E31